ncbi:hypothetical protein BC937DRAFT_87296 [Endogone sp. FLAS-F59071]|nr:hypothetical protein BC937DRAFT_87296 [Endogone sp. FLAS-F59071]|eukprot:RUS12662.1 hypothetical protein BC937DRAFT_87296 [Endogone sp. FLAS-F59071]
MSPNSIPTFRIPRTLATAILLFLTTPASTLPQNLDMQCGLCPDLGCKACVPVIPQQYEGSQSFGIPQYCAPDIVPQHPTANTAVAPFGNIATAPAGNTAVAPTDDNEIRKRDEACGVASENVALQIMPLNQPPLNIDVNNVNDVYVVLQLQRTTLIIPQTPLPVVAFPVTISMIEQLDQATQTMSPFCRLPVTVTEEVVPQEIAIPQTTGVEAERSMQVTAVPETSAAAV